MCQRTSIVITTGGTVLQRYNCFAPHIIMMASAHGVLSQGVQHAGAAVTGAVTGALRHSIFRRLATCKHFIMQMWAGTT
jgi:hypothetical protein